LLREPTSINRLQTIQGKVRISRYATADLAYTVENEHSTVRIGGAADLSEPSLGVTTIFRREADDWKIVHRHAEPISSARPLESLIQA
jgi:ketosteroid isomerase-like protein